MDGVSGNNGVGAVSRIGGVSGGIGGVGISGVGGVSRNGGVRLCVVGGGLAGGLLAWRLAGARPGWTVELVAGAPGADATAVSGGLVRGFETDPGECELAAASLRELWADARLRAWARFRPTGSVYLTGLVPAQLTAQLATTGLHLPGSVVAGPAAELDPDPGFARLPAGLTAVVERAGGHLSPAALRTAVLAELASRGVPVRAAAVARLRVGRASVTCVHADGAAGYDVVVVAAGAWTPRLLSRSDLDAGGYRTKRIQYGIHPCASGAVPAFVDETSGLYGRRHGEGTLLLGLPTDDWGADPGDRRVRPELAERARRAAAERLPALRVGPSLSVHAGVDAYAAPGLALRPVGGADGRVYTFSGGSGSAAKTALAASRRAVAQLAADHDRAGAPRPQPVGA